MIFVQQELIKMTEPEPPAKDKPSRLRMMRNTYAEVVKTYATETKNTFEMKDYTDLGATLMELVAFHIVLLHENEDDTDIVRPENADKVRISAQAFAETLIAVVEMKLKRMVPA
jgi:hypothetical protein